MCSALLLLIFQCDYFSGKSGDVRDFDSYQGDVGEFMKSWGSVKKISYQGKLVTVDFSLGYCSV